jgi:valyl-tRNA synthetase
MIDKTYQPAEVEGRIYAAWEEAGAFRAGRPERSGAEPYCIVIPPPNVTGSLHMGHALNNTLQDILCRFERMRGKDVLWQPGTDHAGIATQMVVERQLMERQEKSRRDMGRPEFLKRVWAWKEESGGTIINQLKRLGASCDWSRERFTMDPGLSKAVLKVFVQLYKEKLIYKDKRLVNWDPKLLTAISDLEVQQVEVKGHLWYIKYPIEGSDEFITVATTRPETMLGDTAVAVHPDDERYKHLVAAKAHAILPLVGRRIPIIADDYSDPEKGTGAVKITPAHDFNDFEVGKRHNLEQINVLDREGNITLRGNQTFLVHMRGAGDTPETSELINWTMDAVDGVDRFVARKRIVARLEERGLLDKIEPNTHTVPHGDRSGTVIEPFLTDQWYVNAKALAVRAIEKVRDGSTTFVPKNWEKTYFEWMENIQPWCISRQLWWGHQVPAWYGPKLGADSIEAMLDEPEIFVASTERDAIGMARASYGCEVRVLPSVPSGDKLQEVFKEIVGNELAGKGRWQPIWRDEDVLDTWFSSALWPFSTLGWPDETKELKRFYPTSVLVTGFDIIFFWVARMMMMGLHFMKEVPFHTVYIHALVRDERGAKMSKSKGNVIDPLALIDEYGADALRFTLIAMAAQGRDIKLSKSRVEGYRNFATKLWNAARFVEFNRGMRVEGFDPKSTNEPLNRWIAHETAKAARDVTEAIEQYRFNDAAGAAYRFVWNVYCDRYVELSKHFLAGRDVTVEAKMETRAMAAWVLDQALKLLHPFMPFITEELWRVTGERGPEREELLALANWPDLVGLETLIGPDEPSFEIVNLVIGEARAIRAELNIAAKNITSLELRNFNNGNTALLRSALSSIARMIGATTKLIGADGTITEAKPPLRPTDDMIVTKPDVPWTPDEAPIAKPPWPDVVVRSPVKEGVIAIIVRAFDKERERGRLEKALAQVDADIARVDAKLGNPQFLAKAPEEVVEEEREKRAEAEGSKSKIIEALERLKGAA